MLLTDADILAIKQIIADHHSAFIVNAIDPDAVAPEVLQALKDKGLVTVNMTGIADAYLYGQIAAALKDPAVDKMSVDAFKDYLRKNPVALTPLERQAVVMNQQQAAQYVKGLGNRIETQTGQMLINADADLRRQMRETITDKTSHNIAVRESVQRLKSDLGWATKDWTRDLDRIAVTEKQAAMQQGVADHVAKTHGPGARVAKRVAPDCCDRCRTLYVGPDGAPRIFTLSALSANGSNAGRKVAAWKPVIGPVHPHCLCELVHVPEGWGFDEHGDLAPGGTYGVATDAERLEASMRRKNVSQPLHKAQPPALRYVIPLEKAAPDSGRISAAMVGRTQAAHHNPKMRGVDGAHFLFNAPPIKPPVRDETLVGKLYPEKVLVTQYGSKPGAHALRRDKRIYEYNETPQRIVKPYRDAGQWQQDLGQRTTSAYLTREWLLKQQQQRAAFRNYADVHAQPDDSRKPQFVLRLPPPDAPTGEANPDKDGPPASNDTPEQERTPAERRKRRRQDAAHKRARDRAEAASAARAEENAQHRDTHTSERRDPPVRNPVTRAMLSRRSPPS